uniref:Uncharacterized protein n=1 Tax=Arundo donax TaxID=35708 RepID=A0A0A9BK92_ARUDO
MIQQRGRHLRTWMINRYYVTTRFDKEISLTLLFSLSQKIESDNSLQTAASS